MSWQAPLSLRFAIAGSRITASACSECMRGKPAYDLRDAFRAYHGMVVANDAT